MSLQNLLDAGVHPVVVQKTRAQSLDIASIIAVVNQFLAVFTGGGGTIIDAILSLLGLFALPVGQSSVPPVDAKTRRQQLLLAGIDAKLLKKAEAMALDPTVIIQWITTIMNVLTVAGPALLNAIIALLNAFNPPAPKPNPGPTLSAAEGTHFSEQA